MYCKVYGVETKFIGLLSTAANAVCEECVQDGFAVLSRDDVQTVVWAMRSELLGGWAERANGYSSYGGSGMPLSNLQDIMHYSRDVQTFELLCLWLAHTDEEELVWA